MVAAAYGPAASPLLSARASTTGGALPPYGAHGRYDSLHLSPGMAVTTGGGGEAGARAKARSKKNVKKPRSSRPARGSAAAGGAAGASAFGGRQASYCGRVLKEMLRIKDAASFSKPITSIWTEEQLPGYHDTVKQPMDLGTVLQQLHDGAYHTLPPAVGAAGGGDGDGDGGGDGGAAGGGDGGASAAAAGPGATFDPAAYAADVRLVFQNALAYNTPGDPFHTAATRLLGRFNDKFAALPAADAPPERRRAGGGASKSGAKSDPADAASSRARPSTRKRSVPEEQPRARDSGDGAAAPRYGVNGGAASGVAASRGRDAQRPLVDSSPVRRASGAGRSGAPAAKRAKKRRVDGRSGGGGGGTPATMAMEESVMSRSAAHASQPHSVASLERELLRLRSTAAAAGDKASVTALRDVPMTYEGKVELSVNVNRLPSEQLQKLVSLVARSTSASFPVNEEQEIELDIDSLDNHTLRDMEAMIHATLRHGRKQALSKAQLTALRKEMAAVEARLAVAKEREAAEAAAAPPPLPPGSVGGGRGASTAVAGAPKRRPRATHSYLSSSSSGSGSSTSRGAGSSTSSGSSTGSSSSGASGASDRSRRQRRAQAAADKQRLAAAVTRPSPAASTTAAAAVPLYPPAGFSRAAGATLAAARSPVSECRPGGRPPTYTKRPSGGSPGEALIGAAAAADAQRGCPSDEEGKAEPPAVAPAVKDARRGHGDGDRDDHDGGKARETPAEADRAPVERRDDGDDGGGRQRRSISPHSSRPDGKGEAQPPPLPAPRNSSPPRERTSDAPAPPCAADQRPPRANPLRSEDAIHTLHPAGSGEEGGGRRSHSPEPPRRASSGAARDNDGPDRPSRGQAAARDAGRDGGPRSPRAPRSGDRSGDCPSRKQARGDAGGGAEAATTATTISPPRVADEADPPLRTDRVGDRKIEESSSEGCGRSPN